MIAPPADTDDFLVCDEVWVAVLSECLGQGDLPGQTGILTFSGVFILSLRPLFCICQGKLALSNKDGEADICGGVSPGQSVGSAILVREIDGLGSWLVPSLTSCVTFKFTPLTNNN